MKRVYSVGMEELREFYDIVKEKNDTENLLAFSKLFNGTIGMDRFSRNEVLRNFINEYYAKIGN